MLDLLAVEPVFTRSAYHVQLTMRDRPPLHGLAAAARAAPGTDRQTDTAPLLNAYCIRGPRNNNK